MYRVIKTDGTELGITDVPVYIKYGESGSFTNASREDAIGVAFQSTPYNLLGHEEIKDAETVILSPVDGGSLIAQQKDVMDEVILTVLEG